MNKFLSFIALVVPCVASAQLVVDSVPDPVASIENIFVNNGVFTSNLEFNGANAQFGLFNGSASTIGLNEGIILSTGSVTNAANGEDMYPSMGLGGDPDLENLTGFVTYDLASIEFDFLATGDSMSFQFVFASDEYPEWVNSSFNDVFGFFVSGPGINGTFTNAAVNIAVVPGTGDFVSINTINETMNASYYIDNAMANTHFCDGFTTVMIAGIGQLTIGESYHMKIAITDVSDQALDSWVFLGGESFSQFCSVGLLEEQERGGAMCMVSQVQAMADYTQFCGMIELDNFSDINVPFTNAYYTMGDGNTLAAELGTQTYTYSEAGEYPIWLVYEVGQFRSQAYVGTMTVALSPAPMPVIAVENGTLSVTNYADVDPLPAFQWYLNGEAIEGATGLDFTPTEIGTYFCVANNGCPVQSESITLVGVLETNAPVLGMYPNPAAGPVTLRWSGEPSQVYVYNTVGQVVFTAGIGGNPLVMDALSAGHYQVVVVGQNGEQRFRSSLVVSE